MINSERVSSLDGIDSSFGFIEALIKQKQLELITSRKIKDVKRVTDTLRKSINSFLHSSHREVIHSVTPRTMVNSQHIPLH